MSSEKKVSLTFYIYQEFPHGKKYIIEVLSGDEVRGRIVCPTKAELIEALEQALEEDGIIDPGFQEN